MDVCGRDHMHCFIIMAGGMLQLLTYYRQIILKARILQLPEHSSMKSVHCIEALYWTPGHVCLKMMSMLAVTVLIVGGRLIHGSCGCYFSHKDGGSTYIKDRGSTYIKDRGSTYIKDRGSTYMRVYTVSLNILSHRISQFWEMLCKTICLSSNAVFWWQHICAA